MSFAVDSHMSACSIPNTVFDLKIDEVWGCLCGNRLIYGSFDSACAGNTSLDITSP